MRTAPFSKSNPGIICWSHKALTTLPNPCHLFTQFAYIRLSGAFLEKNESWMKDMERMQMFCLCFH